jgi:isopenicillin N synthase-like dioxygenase
MAFGDSFSLPPSLKSSCAASNMDASHDDTSITGPGNIPLIELPVGEQCSALVDVSSVLVTALQTSGFLLVQSPHLTADLQQSALATAQQLLIGRDGDDLSRKAMGDVIDHPTDPKVYMMIDSLEDIFDKCGEDSGAATLLTEYWTTLECIKRQILRCIAIGLDLDAEYFVALHSKNQSVLRLLHYYGLAKAEPEEGVTVRGKAHSDYGSITLLSTDGVPGLQAFIDDKWIPVPYVRGALVVNIGSLLQDWTNGALLATLHRVVSVGDETAPRTSIAFFADPDPGVSVILSETAQSSSDMSVAEYIRLRSGGEGPKRSGVAFSSTEEKRAQQAIGE